MLTEQDWVVSLTVHRRVWDDHGGNTHEEMPLTYAETTRVQMARDYLQTTLDLMMWAGKVGWVQGAMTQGDAHCVVGWLRTYCLTKNQVVQGYKTVALRALVRALPKGRLHLDACTLTTVKGCEQALIYYNDSFSTHCDDVLALFKRAIADLDVQLAGSMAAYREAQAIVEAELAKEAVPVA